MSHPKNSTDPSQRQLLATHAFDCGGLFFDVGLVQIGPDVPVHAALDLARALACGAEQMCKRLHDQINRGAYASVDEIAALGFLSCISASLIQASRRGIEIAGGDQ